MTASGAVPATAVGAPPASGGARAWAVPAVIIVVTLLAIGLRLYDLSRPGYLFGVSEYDDGTDFGSAIRLVHGGVPYRDFIMVQPPGITLIMFPVALITKGMGTITGMAVARVVTALASAAAVPVTGLLTRHRGFLATLVACGVLALYPDSVLASRTVLLEPWLVLFCLLGALAVFDRDQIAESWRRLLLGGILFGFVGAVKVWAILPVVVILALTARKPRRAAAYAAGVVLGFCAPVLPFALTAPTTFYRSVIIAQLVRNDVTRIPQGYRLQQMLGLVHVSQLATPPLVIIGIAVAVLLAAVAVLGSRLSHRGPPPLDWFIYGTCVLVVAAFLWPADFYYHYAGFIAPFAGLVIALPVSRLLAALAAGEGRRWQALARPWATGIAAVALVVLTVFQVVAEAHESSGVPASEIAQAQRIIPPGACVATDQASYTIAINRFVSAVPGCSLMIDGVGTDYALSNGRNGQTGAGRSPAVAAAWMALFQHARYAWLTTQEYRRVPWTPRLLAYFNRNFVPLTEGPDWLYVRTAHPLHGPWAG